MDDSIKKEFKQEPETTGQDIADYFNLEFGLTFDDTAKKFTESDFNHFGVYISKKGIETVYWSVKSKKALWATEQPYQDSSLLGMTDQNPDELIKLR